MKVEVVPHRLEWRREFEQESDQIAIALNDILVAVHHIGSTAIPSIYAKPIIDILVEVKTITLVDKHRSTMEKLGYEAMGEFGIAGRRYFRKGNRIGVRTHHVHVFTQGSLEVTRHLAFRDYMIAHPEIAQQYSELKRCLAQSHPTDIELYMDGKDGFIKEMEHRALELYLC
ncbi:MAG: GrpB family protein [Elainellaceae cyanobacterium]